MVKGAVYQTILRKSYGRNTLFEAVFPPAIVQLLSFQLKLLIMDQCGMHILITLDSRLSNCDVTSDEFEEVEAEINNTEIYEKLPLLISYLFLDKRLFYLKKV